MGAKISKHYSSYKWQPNVLKPVLNFLPMVVIKLRWGILKFRVSDFKRFLLFFFENFKFTMIVDYGEIKKNVNYLENELS